MRCRVGDEGSSTSLVAGGWKRDDDEATVGGVAGIAVPLAMMDEDEAAAARDLALPAADVSGW